MAHPESKNRSDPDPRAEALVRENQKLSEGRAPWDGLWQDLGDHVMTRKADITRKSDTPDTTVDSDLFDGTAVWANEVQASGMIAWFTPHDSPWARFMPRTSVRRRWEDNRVVFDEIVRWHGNCTEAITELLQYSNFYEEAHESHLDRGGFGTTAFATWPETSDVVRFEALPTGSYNIAEDRFGRVSRFFTEIEMTAQAAVDYFGLVTDSLPEKLVEQAKMPEQRNEKHTFVWAVVPRPPSEQDRVGALGMPWASYYICKEDRQIVRESGFWQMPIHVGRFLKWGKAPYGYSPAWRALADTRTTNHIVKHLLALAEVAAFPRYLVPTDFEGNADVSAYGETPYDPSQPKPEEWLTGGNYTVGKDILENRQAAIERAFNVDVFRMFQDINKEMREAEVLEMRAERMVMFAPSVSRYKSEILDPTLRFVYSEMARASSENWSMGAHGLLPIPPDELFEEGLPFPEVEYVSRMAFAMSDNHSSGFLKALDVGLQVAPFEPGIFDNMDLGGGFRDYMRAAGVPEARIRDEAEVQEIAQARAMALAASEAAGEAAVTG